MYKVLFVIVFLFLNLTSVFKVSANESVEQTLDRFHQAAANANFTAYFDIFADDAVFLGTDGSERWTKAAFKSFVKPYFSEGRGWLYTPTERHISSIQNSHVVFFDELLHSKTYGQCRGSGVLIQTSEGWKILQYNLSIPIPNAIAGEVVKVIKQDGNTK